LTRDFGEAMLRVLLADDGANQRLTLAIACMRFDRAVWRQFPAWRAHWATTKCRYCVVAILAHGLGGT
jgi:hypothetical protein